LQDSGFKKKDRSKTNIPQEQFVYSRGGEPKVMKKVVNSVLASALALTVAPMAFAAEEATNTEAPKVDESLQKVVNRLAALGLVAGYGNGDFGVDRTINRAEFATLIVRMRGLEQGAKLAQFQSNFTDVKSSDWFAGFVNVASGQEIVKGFPDKTFKPANNVTYAEAVTMIVRALGYEPSVKGVWPNNMIAKASELNIAKNITNPNNAATRGDIFKMMDNALRVKLMEQVEYGTDIRFNITDETLLTRYLDVTVRDMEWLRDQEDDDANLPMVTNVPVIGLGALEGNEITLDGKDAGLGGSSVTYKVADGINPNEFAGQHVQVWIKDDKENTIVWMEGSEDEEVVMDRTDTFYFKNKTVKDGSSLTSDSDLKDLKLSLDASGKSYRFSEDVNVVYNFQRYSDPTEGLDEIIKQAQDYNLGVKLVLNDDDEIVYIHAIDDQSFDQTKKGVKYGSEVIEKIDADKKKIENLDGRNFTDLEDLEEGKDFLVFLDNKPAKLADLKPMDVYSVYYADGDDEKLLVFANRTVVEGKVDKVVTRSSTDLRLTIGDKTYRLRKGTTYSDNANKDIETIDDNNWNLIDDLDGEEVKLYLDPSGRIRHIETKDSLDDRKLKAIVTRAAVYNEGEDKYSFVVLTENGKKLNVNLDKDDIKDVDGVDFGDDSKDEDQILNLFKPSKTQPALLEVELDADGDVSEVKIVDAELKHLSGSAWDDAADEDDSVVGDYEVTDDTAIFDMTGKLDTSAKRPELKDAKTATFKNIADENDLDVYYVVDEEDDEVEAIFVVEGSGLGGDTQYGYVLNYGSSAGVDSVVLLTKDADNNVVEKEYKLDDDKEELLDRGIKRGDFIAFELNGEEVVVDDVIEVVDAAIDSEKARILDEDKWEEAKLDSVVVARVDDVDGDTITYNGKKLYTNSSTAFIDAFDDLEGIDGVDEGDLIVLIDTDDDGTRFDYVLQVADEDYLEENDISEDAIKAFLEQTKVPTPGDKVPSFDQNQYQGTATASKLIPTISSYTVSGKINNADAVESVTFKVGTKTADVTVEQDGSFEASVVATTGATEGELTLTYKDAEGATKTVKVTVKF
jgi:hypothetical protein